MAFPELLQHVGNFGRFQIILSVLTLLVVILTSTHNFLEIFSAAIPAHRCYIHLLDNTTSETKDTMNLTVEDLLRISIPMGPNQRQEQCRRFRQIQWQLLEHNELATNTTELETEPCLDGWTYDQSIFTSTIVTQWDLVCDSQSLKSLSQSIFTAGYTIGAPLSGYTGDRFGRKTVLLAFSLFMAFLGTFSVFAQTFPVYCTIRFFMSLSLGTIYNNSVVLLLEWLPTNARPMIATAFSLTISSGQILLAGLAYVFRDWHMLQLSTSVPYFVFFLFLWWLSESARWLIVSGKLEKALKEMKRVAHLNGRKDVAENLHIEVLKSEMKDELAFLKNNSKKVKAIANPTIQKIIFLLCFLRFSAIFFVYGLMFDLQHLGSDMFLSQALLGVVDLPTKLLSFFVMKFFKRRPSIAFVFSLAGFLTFINIFIPQDIPFMRLGIAMMGKGSMAMYFSISVTYNHEFTPTAIRSTMQGLLAFTSGVAATLGSLVSITRQYFEPLPMILYGTFPIVASICVYFLPETMNLPLPDTIEEVEKRDKNYRKKCTKEQINNLLDTTEC
nr:solute carrier family 22 member 22-like [Dasypus novemcinctus]